MPIRAGSSTFTHMHMSYLREYAFPFVAAALRFGEGPPTVLQIVKAFIWEENKEMGTNARIVWVTMRGLEIIGCCYVHRGVDGWQ